MMKTKEELVHALEHAIESELHQLVRTLMNEADVPRKPLEQHVLQAVFGVGRRWPETLLAWRTGHVPAAARRQGACGHRQHLVGWRTKTLLTLLGQVRWSRPYYQCQAAAALGAAASVEPDPVCGHGEAPADVVPGVATAGPVLECRQRWATWLPRCPWSRQQRVCAGCSCWR
jgi:hypothetical protein